MLQRISIWLMIGFCIPHASNAQIKSKQGIQEKGGAFIRSDTSKKTIYLMFTAHEFGEGIPFILQTFDQLDIKASFFFTGDFIRNNEQTVQQIHLKGHYVGPHSDKHLLYCDWSKRDSLLLPMDSIRNDLRSNMYALLKTGIPQNDIPYFMPPYEWYNNRIAEMTEKEGLTLLNFTPGTSSNADYTTPDMPNYLSSDSIFNRIIRYESTQRYGLNGFHMLIHAGTDPKRTDKLYARIPELISILHSKGYEFKRMK